MSAFLSHCCSTFDLSNPFVHTQNSVTQTLEEKWRIMSYKAAPLVPKNVSLASMLGASVTCQMHHWFQQVGGVACVRTCNGHPFRTTQQWSHYENLKTKPRQMSPQISPSPNIRPPQGFLGEIPKIDLPKSVKMPQKWVVFWHFWFLHICLLHMHTLNFLTNFKTPTHIHTEKYPYTLHTLEGLQ